MKTLIKTGITIKTVLAKKKKLILKRYKITSEEWKIVKTKTQFAEVNEELIANEVEQL